MKKSKNLKLIKKEDFGHVEYCTIGQETITTLHHFTLKQKDGFVLNAKITQILTDCGKLYYNVWSLKGSDFPYRSTYFKTYNELIEMYSIWADDIKNDTLMGQTIS